MAGRIQETAERTVEVICRVERSMVLKRVAGGQEHADGLDEDLLTRKTIGKTTPLTSNSSGALSVPRPTVTGYRGGAQMLHGEPAVQAQAGHPEGARPWSQRRMCTVIWTAPKALPATPATATATAASSLPVKARTRTVARVARVVTTVAHT